MKDLIQFLLENIVANEKAIEINQQENEEETVFLINVAEEDRGKVIGKNGKIITAIRNIVGIKAQKDNQRVFVKLDF